MDSTQTATSPVNPLTGGLASVKVSSRRDESGFREVQGLVVAPGLAITPHSDNGGGKKPDRYLLTHIPSGLSAGTTFCGVHVQQAAKAAAESGVDWTVDKTAVVDAIKASDGLIPALFHVRCADWCDGDGPKPASWNVRCSTCDWEYDPEDDIDEGPLTYEEARRMGRDHECEPFIEISAPDTSEWHPDWRFDKVGQLIPTTSVCANCDQPIKNIGRSHGALWQHDGTRFVMCADGHSHAEPKTTTDQRKRLTRA